MLDPISLTAITGVLGAVGLGMANEAGKWAWESAGGLVRRIAGREVRAPAAPDEVEAVARLVHAGVRQDPALARAWTAFARGVPARGSGGSGGGVRREFPASTRFFTDRDDAMKKLDREASRAPDGRPRTALLHGAPGMGTSALAVHWGCREASRRFADGQLYVDLRGTSAGSALDAAAVPRALLRQLGVDEGAVPPAPRERLALYRELVADKRLLVVLDHAHSTAQVSGVLTSAPGVFVLVVAAGPLAGLDAVPVEVGPLRERDAVRLLTDLVGKETVRGADDRLHALLSRCGGSPFALRAAAPALAAPHPAPARTPEVTAAAETDPVRAAAEDAAERVSPGAARLYRLMALRPWPAFAAPAAAAAAGSGEEEAAAHLDELVAARLIERDTHTDGTRHWYRPVIRAHAQEAAVREDGLAACSAAVTRTVAAYALLARRAAHAALPESWRVPPLPDGVAPGTYPTRAQAVGALADELGNLAQAVQAAEEFGDPGTAVALARALWPLQLKAGHHEALLPPLRLAARTADARFPGSRTAGALHAQVAHSLTELRRDDEAEAQARAAAASESAAGHPRGHASSVEFLGLLRLRQWRYEEAYDSFEEAAGIYATLGPGDEGAADLPRARALLERHKGRALRGMGRLPQARERLEEALRFFRSAGEAYNTARVLTDLAETALASGEAETALALVDEARPLLDREGAAYHLDFLAALRERCLTPPRE